MVGFGIVQRILDRLLGSSESDPDRVVGPIRVRLPYRPKPPKPLEHRHLYRNCTACHKPIYVTHAYRTILGPADQYGARRIAEVWCSRECYQERIDRTEKHMIKKYGMGYYELLHKRKDEATLAELCQIVKQHDDDLKHDPERLDIGKFIGTYVPCLHDKKRPEPPKPDEPYTVTSGFRQKYI